MKERLFLLFVCLFARAVLSMAQVGRVSGNVVSGEDGLPVVGASVLIKGTQIGTVTDFDGNFTLTEIPSGATVLQVSYLGMKTQEVPLQEQVKVVLASDTQVVDEVVVVAYGTQKASTLTASVSSIRSDALKDVPNTSLDQMMQGRAAGMSITSPSGGVGQAPVVHIRGVNSITSGTSPLYVVDGIPVQSGDLGGGLGNANALADINPADILSIDVLKDAAAAALYGSRAANGVVLITTRQGSQGKATISYSGSFGFSSKTNFIDVMNAQEYVDFKNMALRNAYGTDVTAELLAKGVNGLKESGYGNKVFNLMPGVDTNWSDAIFQNGFTQDQTVAVNGGNERVRYYVSANYNTQKGIVRGDSYSRIGGKVNLTGKATDWLNLGLNSSISVSNTAQVDAARNGSNFAVGGFPRMALINAPNLPMYDSEGNGYYDHKLGVLGYGPNAVLNSFSNPLALLELGNRTTVDVTRLISSFFAEINPVAGLILKSQYSIDYAGVENSRFWSPNHGDGVNAGGYALNAYSKSTVWTWTNTATYDVLLGRHHFNLLAGMEATESSYNTWYASRSKLQDDKFTDFQGPFGTATAGGNILRNTMVSYFGRINYDFASKYIFSFNYRRDGLSALAPQNRWGNFGGASVAWRVSEEPFFEPLRPIINDLKIKGSYGVVGNTNIGSYASRSFYSSYYYGNNGTYQLAQLSDPNLKWESSEKYDVGFSALLLDRINVDFDYFFTRASDLILNVPQAPSKGIPGNVLTTNAGKMENKGIELTISAEVIRKKNFTWSTSLNLTTTQNKVIALADGLDNILGKDASGVETTNITVPGYSIGQLYLTPTGGVDPETGLRVFYSPTGERLLFDYRSDSKWRYEDGRPYEGELQPVLSGNTLPTWYGGWTNNFTLGNFDLSFFFQFSGGNKIYNGTRATTSDMRFWNNSKDVLNNYWTPGKTDAVYPLPVYGDNISNGSGIPITEWVEKGDYLRLKNVSLGYTFDTRKWPKSIGISKLRVYAQAQNLFVLTGYSGVDPEVMSNATNSTLAPGTDKNTLPQARTYTFGVNITF